MYRNYQAGFIAALFALFLSFPLAAEEAPTTADEIAALEEQSRVAYEDGRALGFYIANRKLSELRPYEPEYTYRMARACALMGRRSNAYEYMLKLQQQGVSYDLNATEDTMSIRDSEAYSYINGLLVEAGKPAGDGSVAFTLPGEPADFEAIAWDGSREKILVGTLREGTVLAVGDDGKKEVLLKADDKNGLWSIHGLAVDVERNRLWISSSATPEFGGFSPAVKGGSAVSEFKLDSLELVGRFDVPADELKHKLGSIAVTNDGHVYVIDRNKPIIYRKMPESTKLEAYVAHPELVSLTDLAVAPDNSKLFVSDTAMGIWVIDPVVQQAAMLAGPETLNLGGITGMEFIDGKLLVIQNGFNPQRLIRLNLDNGDSEVGEVAPMAIALESFDGPGTSTLTEDSIYYFANSSSQDSKAGAIIMRSPLTAGSDIEPPDMRMFKQSIPGQQQRSQE